MTNEKSKKVTKKQRFEQLLTLDAVKANADLVTFIEHELELLAKKNASNGEKKLTPTQVANNGFKETILEVLNANGQAMTVTDIIKAHEGLADLSNQRVSALLRQLYNSGLVERIEEKRKTYFKIAE